MQGVVNESWHQYESAFDDTTQSDAITVTAGQTVNNITFILNGTPPRFDKFEDPSALLNAPPFPFVLREPESIAALTEQA